jgi:hypothetical protein
MESLELNRLSNLINAFRRGVAQEIRSHSKVANSTGFESHQAR